MTDAVFPSFVAELAGHLRGFLSLCEQTLGLVTVENHALAGAADY